jgi:hypothetical protein
MDATGGGGSVRIASRIINLGTRWRWVVSFVFRLIYLRSNWTLRWVGGTHSERERFGDEIPPSHTQCYLHCSYSCNRRCDVKNVRQFDFWPSSEISSTGFTAETPPQKLNEISITLRCTRFKIECFYLSMGLNSLKSRLKNNKILKSP